ncbi:MAG: lytic transglycosylase domain-containing protein [Candidatus Hydrogenedens sp.]
MLFVKKKKIFLRTITSLFFVLLFSNPIFTEPHVSSEQKIDGVSSQGTKIYKIDLKEAYADRSREKGLYQFQRKDGTLVFTNRPQKYRSKSEYKEVYFKKSPNTQQITKKGTITKDSTENNGYAIIVPLEPVHVSKKFEHLYKGKVYNFEAIQKIVKECSQYYQVDEKLIWAVMEVESAFNPNAVSNAGACGLMQLMPATAVEMGVTDIFDPAQNIAGGVQYLNRMLDLFNGNIDFALAGYNAGPENVKKYKGIPPFDETINYVKLVKSKLGLKLDANYYASRMSGKITAVKRNISTAGINSGKKYMVYFKSGLRQPADDVVEQAPYYYISYGNRTYPVRTELVQKVEKTG